MKFYDKNRNEHDTQIGAFFTNIKNKFVKKDEKDLVIYDTDGNDEKDDVDVSIEDVKTFNANPWD